AVPSTPRFCTLSLHDALPISALHPRYSRAQRDRVMEELLPRTTELARLARSYDIGLNIDAEEADRLEISLDILEALCFDPGLSRSEEHTSELQSRENLVCRLL